MTQRGRRNKYETNVKPHLAQIKEWLKVGATVAKICDTLKISESSWYAYEKQYSEFSEAIKCSVGDFCLDLRGELAKLATKHTLETKKQYIKQDVETGSKTQYTEITTKEVDADKVAIHMLLKNLDPDWHDDPAQFDLRKQELELRKEIAKASNFDLNI